MTPPSHIPTYSSPHQVSRSVCKKTSSSILSKYSFLKEGPTITEAKALPMPLPAQPDLDPVGMSNPTWAFPFTEKIGTKIFLWIAKLYRGCHFNARIYVLNCWTVKVFWVPLSVGYTATSGPLLRHILYKGRQENSSFRRVPRYSKNVSSCFILL